MCSTTRTNKPELYHIDNQRACALTTYERLCLFGHTTRHFRFIFGTKFDLAENLHVGVLGYSNIITNYRISSARKVYFDYLFVFFVLLPVNSNHRKSFIMTVCGSAAQSA